MPSNKDNQSRVQPTLEDLLRLKRAERPDAAFWQDFERGMRQKQLAAIIEPRPWWLGLSLLSRRIGPVALPVSAGAAAMLALVVMRVSPAGGLTQIVPSSSPEPVAVAAAPAPAPSPAAVAAVPAVTPRPAVQVASSAKAKPSPVVVDQRPANTTPVAVAATPAATEKNPAKVAKTTRAEIVREEAKVASVNAAPKVEISAATASEIVAPLASASLPAPAVEANNTSEDTFSVLGLSDKQGETLDTAIEGLNPRQARLLASAAEVAEGKSLAPVRERVLHRLVDDEARYASISRLGVNADRLSLKF